VHAPNTTASPLALALTGELGIGVGGRLVRVVAALLPVVIHRRVARIIGWRLVVFALLLEALERRPRLNQRAVDREVVGAHQLRPASMIDDRPQKLPGRVVDQQAVAVVSEDRRHEALFDHVHVEEPAEEQVVVELLAELSLAANRVQRDQQHRRKKPLWRDRGPTALRVHGVQDRR
jgi:hypothetical protein